MTKKTITQQEMRQGVHVDRGLRDLTSVTQWYRGNHFSTDAEAKGAFKLAYQQALDGMGRSTAHWMGMTDNELDDWIQADKLPER